MRRSSVFSLICLLAAVLVSCQLLSEPESGYEELNTPRGTLLINPGPCEVNQTLLLEEVELGYRKGLDQRKDVDNISIDGLRLDFTDFIGRTPFLGDITAQYEWAGQFSSVKIVCGEESALDHELQHHFCRNLSLHKDHFLSCCLRQDHNPGYDLHCNPR